MQFVTFYYWCTTGVFNLLSSRANLHLYINNTVEGVCLYIDYFFPILRFLFVSCKTKTIQVVFSFGVCLSVCLFVCSTITWKRLFGFSPNSVSVIYVPRNTILVIFHSAIIKGDGGSRGASNSFSTLTCQLMIRAQKCA